MALINNPNYNPSIPNSDTNQPFIFDNPNQIINQQTGQTAATLGGTTPITSADLIGNASPITPISAPIPDISGANAAATGAATGATWTYPSEATGDAAGNIATPPPTGTPTETPDYWARIKALMGISTLPEPISAEEKQRRENERLRLEAEQTANTKAISDANAELAAATAEWNNLKMNEQYIPEAMQEQAKGRGITEAGLAPLTAGELRKNALAMLPVTQRVLVASAKVSAAQGRYDLAEKAINKILDIQDKTRQEEYNVYYKNLDMAIMVADKEDADKLAKKKEETRIQENKDKEFSNNKKDFKDEAISSGQYDLAGQIAMATTQEELNRLIGQIKPKAEKAPIITQTEKTRELKTSAFTKARPFLEQSRGKDGYVDPGVYLRLRSDYAEVIGDPSSFDAIFAPFLSPEERARLGLGKATGVEALPENEESLY